MTDIRENYAALILAVIGSPKDDLMPLNRSDFEAIGKVLESLGTPHQRSHHYKDIISLRFGLRDANRYSLKETADRFGISREGVRQLEKKALIMLRQSGRIEVFCNLFRSQFERRLQEQQERIAELEGRISNNSFEELFRLAARLRLKPHSSLEEVMLAFPKLSKPVADLEVSVRAQHLFELLNIRILGELIQIPEEQLLKTKGIGVKTFRELEAIVEGHGLRFGMKIPHDFLC